MHFESTIDEWFDTAPYAFVMDGLAATIQSVMINNIRYLKHLERGGVRKLLANVEAMEQVIAIVSTSKAERFEKVREYYRLVLLDGDGLMSVLSDPKQAHRFTLPEYQGLLQVKYGQSGDPERTKELSNQLVRLKYLFEESSASK